MAIDLENQVLGMPSIASDVEVKIAQGVDTLETNLQTSIDGLADSLEKAEVLVIEDISALGVATATGKDVKRLGSYNTGRVYDDLTAYQNGNSYSERIVSFVSNGTDTEFTITGGSDGSIENKCLVVNVVHLPIP
jgi:hypothetical protein